MALFSRKRKRDNDSDGDGFAFFDNCMEDKQKQISEKISLEAGQINPNMPAPATYVTKNIGDTAVPVKADEEYPVMRTEQLPVTAAPKGAQSLVGTSIILGKRSNQQDALAVSNPVVTGSFSERWIGVLCDGMGGMNGGERASNLSVNATIEAYSRASLQESFNIPEFYRDVIAKIDFDVSSLEDEQGRYIGAGTTFISIMIDKGLLYWASVGDSHIYIIRGNQIKMIVREHNYLMDLLEMAAAGEITYEAAYSDKSKDALTSYIGMGGVTLMDVTETPVSLIPGDVIMLCSDGLYRSVSDEEILQIVSANTDMNVAAEALTQVAMMKNNPYQDNTSVVLAKYQ